MCGIAADDADPKALVRRAERALYFGETIVMRAVDGDDDRLALQGLDRVRTSLEQLLKVHGLLQPDGATTVIVNQEVLTFKAALALVVGVIPGEQRQAEALTLLLPFFEEPVTVDVMPALQSGTRLRDQTGLISP